MIDTLLHYNTHAPRYTSYPPANLFSPAKDKAQIERLWRASNQLMPQNLSFYFHIPFCVKKCLFCGCTSETLHNEVFRNSYFEAMHKEMDEKLPWIDPSRVVTQIHFGGGTPTSVPLRFLRELVDKLRSKFTFSPNAEIAIECNPSIIDDAHLNELADIGFNRVSYGIQDFNRQTLRDIGREPSLMPEDELLAKSRALGFHGINLDFIYGLPGQTQHSFCKSIERAIELKPDRIALFSYAHLPKMFPNQKKLEVYGIPDPREKISFFLKARAMFKDAGFIPVGMDHFVLPSDSLAKAAKKGMLHRNFQGYCTRETTGQVYAFGSSAISQFDNAYVQNTHHSVDYIKRIREDCLLECRAQELTAEQKVLRNVIERLMCNNYLAVSAEEKAIVGDGWNRLVALEKENLLTKVSDNEIQTTELGTLVIRYLAMQLDPLMQHRTGASPFSNTI